MKNEMETRLRMRADENVIENPYGPRIAVSARSSIQEIRIPPSRMDSGYLFDRGYWKIYLDGKVIDRAPTYEAAWRRAEGAALVASTFEEMGWGESALGT